MSNSARAQRRRFLRQVRIADLLEELGAHIATGGNALEDGGMEVVLSWRAAGKLLLALEVAAAAERLRKARRRGRKDDPETRTPQPEPSSTSSPTPPGDTTDPR